jgi:hypothetical protein
MAGLQDIAPTAGVAAANHDDVECCFIHGKNLLSRDLLVANAVPVKATAAPPRFT